MQIQLGNLVSSVGPIMAFSTNLTTKNETPDNDASQALSQGFPDTLPSTSSQNVPSVDTEDSSLVYRSMSELMHNHYRLCQSSMYVTYVWSMSLKPFSRRTSIFQLAYAGLSANSAIEEKCEHASIQPSGSSLGEESEEICGYLENSNSSKFKSSRRSLKKGTDGTRKPSTRCLLKRATNLTKTLNLRFSSKPVNSTGELGSREKYPKRRLTGELSQVMFDLHVADQARFIES
jgi:hypothetical protein